MHVVIDARRIQEEATGIGRYAYKLLQNLPSLAPEDTFTAIVTPKQLILLKDLPNIKYYVTSFSLENHFLGDLWRQFVLPIVLKARKADVFHDPGMLSPIFSMGVPKVVTMHDLAHYRFAETNSFKYVLYMRLMTRIVTRYAQYIITDCKAIEVELRYFFPIIKKREAARDRRRLRIEPILLGVEEQFFADDAVSGPEADFTPGPPTEGYLLAVSNMEPRKNFTFLLDVYEAWRLNSELTFPLIIAGTKGWNNELFFKKLSVHPFQNDIQITGYLADKELRTLYRDATVFLMPSKYEGFGLPALEAMASRTPVIASNVSSLPEALGDCGFLLAPDDKDGWVDAINKIIKDAKLVKTLTDSGFERAKTFSWKACAEKTLKVYKAATQVKL